MGHGARGLGPAPKAVPLPRTAGDLQQLLSRHTPASPLPLAQLLPLAADVAGALEFLHCQKVIHRPQEQAEVPFPSTWIPNQGYGLNWGSWNT